MVHHPRRATDITEDENNSCVMFGRLPGKTIDEIGENSDRHTEDDGGHDDEVSGRVELHCAQ